MGRVMWVGAADRLQEAAAWSGLASNDALEMKHRLEAALEALKIYEDHIWKQERDERLELAIKTALAYTKVDALVTKKHAQDLYEDIMKALYSAGLVGNDCIGDVDEGV